ncbi:MAG: rod shape-determining protein MreC [Stomatobaculum sp.]|nr:rod shape-determining protein MreC [Stomatobaculum sp.]
MKVSNNRLILIILSILCIVMIGVTTLRDEWLSPLRTAVGYLLMPVQSGVNRVGKSLYNSIKDHEELKSALEDKRELQEQIDQLVMENTRLQADRFELARLRRLYELNQEYGQYRMTGARVIAKDTGGWFHIFRIDKGAADGIRVDMNVLAGGGLVGIVTDVGANYATVRSIIDDVSRVSAMEISSGDTCIVSGDLQLYTEGKLRISDITDTSTISEGDKIVTSTVSSKYLPGILIGYVKELKTDPARLTRSGTLIPAADFGTLQEVLVAMELKSEMTEHPEPVPPAEGVVETVPAPGETAAPETEAEENTEAETEEEREVSRSEEGNDSGQDNAETEETESVVIVERGT